MADEKLDVVALLDWFVDHTRWDAWMSRCDARVT